MEYLDPAAFLKQMDTSPAIDVRAPAEYARGHISGAVPMPVFNDEERSRVGTTYKEKGRADAIELGHQIVAPRENQLAAACTEIACGAPLGVYCWRGGMRSAKVASFLEAQGLACFLLEGGYKRYRNFLLDVFQRADNLIVLSGATGSGKTDMLHALAGAGEQVLDLEGLAHHKGSSFGGIEQQVQPPTQQFQARLLRQWLKLDPGRPVWIESESLTIGRCYLPETLWQAMNAAPCIEVQIDGALRVRRLVDEYGKLPVDELKAAVKRLDRRLGGQHVQQCLEWLDAGMMTEVCKHLLDYYDRSYNFSRSKYKKGRLLHLDLRQCPETQWVEELLPARERIRTMG